MPGGGDAATAGGEEHRAAGAGRAAKRPRAERGQRVELGGLLVDPIGLGTMPLGIEYPDPARRPSRAAAVALLHAAFRSGVEVLDTADSYCAGPGGSAEAAEPHYVERLIAEAMRTFDGDAGRVRICTKGGMQRISSLSSGWRPRACTGPAVRQMIAESHEALGGERPIDVWMLHHADALTPAQLEAALGAMRAEVEKGTVLNLGLANATVGNLELAGRLGIRIAAVQNQYSLWSREAEMPRAPGSAPKSRRGVLEWCAARGCAFMPYAAFGGVQCRDGRRSLRGSFPRLAEMAARRGCSPEALVLAWMRQRFACIVHIAGARSLEHVLDCAAARSISLAPGELEEISALRPARAPRGR